MDTEIEGHLGALQSGSASLRVEAAKKLGEIGDQALHYTQGFVRASVVEALGRLGRSVVPGLLDALQDSDSSVRGSAAQALGKIGAASALPHLLDLLQDRNGTARKYAAEAVGCYGMAVVPTLLEMLRDTRRRIGAVTALEQIDDPAVTPALLQAIYYSDRGCLYGLSAAIKRIGPAARPYIMHAMMDPHEFIRANAATALGYIGDSSDVPVLVVALRDSGVFGRVRSSAAEALGSLKDASAVPALREAIHDRHPTVRANAIFALAEICGLSVVSEILQALADNNESVREHAIYALVNLDTAAIPVLEEALNHSSEAIRSGATDALRRIHENKTDYERDGDPFIEPVNGTRPSGINPEA